MGAGMCAAEADSQVSRAAANYRAISRVEAAEAPTPSLELVEESSPRGWRRYDELVAENWVDCAELASSSARLKCLKKLGLGPPSKRHGHKGGAKAHKKSHAAEKALKAMRKATASLAPKAKSSAGEVAKKAQAKAEMQQKLAAKAEAASEKHKKQAMEALAKARARIEREQKKGGPGNKWEVWYKEKVHKVNLKLHADKKAIKAKRDAKIHTAKSKARAAGAHVSDLGT